MDRTGIWEMQSRTSHYRRERICTTILSLTPSPAAASSRAVSYTHLQLFLPAVGGKLHPAAPGQRLELQMHLGIVAQRLIMAHALDGLGDGLLI